MAYISSLTATAIQNVIDNSTNELSYTNNDTIPCNNSIYYSTNLNVINTYRTSFGLATISAANINSNLYSLQVFLCTGIDGSNNFTGIVSNTLINLSSANVSGSAQPIVSAALSTVFQSLKHSDLCDSFTQAEVYQLCREYKIIFRLTPTSSPVTTTSIQNGDLVQDFKLVLDTSSSGPYGVKFEYLDLLNPSDFSESELLSIYTNNFGIAGSETHRAFYPKNITSLSSVPVVLFCHGIGHQAQQYDAYASLLASYGYFVLSLTSNPQQTANPSYRIFCILKQLKEQITKIKSGYFSGKIDFTKLILAGQSYGGDNVNCAAVDIQRNSITPSVSGLTFSDIICCVLMEDRRNSSFGAGFTGAANMPSITISTSNGQEVNGSDPRVFLNAKELYNATDSFRGNIFVRHSRHDEMGFPITAEQTYLNLPQTTTAPSSSLQGFYLTGTGYTKNSMAPNYYWISQNVLKFISIIFKNKIKNLLSLTNNDLKSAFEQSSEATSAFQFKYKSTDILYNIDTLGNTLSYTTGMTYDFIKETYKVDDVNDFTTLLNAKYAAAGITSFSEYDNSYYNNGNVVFSHYSDTTKGFTYTYGSPLDLTRSGTAKNINVVMGLVTESPIAGTTACVSESSYNHCSVYLTDNVGATATISSKQRNLGIPNSNKGFVNTSGSLLAQTVGFIPGTHLIFTLQDFKSQNSNIDLTNISKLQLLFGSTYGSNILNYERFVYNGTFLT
jgi:hypothetical protein